MKVLGWGVKTMGQSLIVTFYIKSHSSKGAFQLKIHSNSKNNKNDDDSSNNDDNSKISAVARGAAGGASAPPVFCLKSKNRPV